MYEFNPRFGFGWPTDRVNPLDSGTGWCSDVTRRVTNGYDQDIKESPRFGKPGAPIGLDSVVFRCDTRLLSMGAADQLAIAAVQHLGGSYSRRP
jgi:hypothetical protein